MIAFIDDQRAAHGVEPICKVLPVAPSTYDAHVAKRVYSTKLSSRARRDLALKPEIARVFAENFEVYGVRKVWRQLGREGFSVARCAVARLMKSMVLQGVIRGKPVKTTVQDKAAPCPLDRVNRQFHAPAPNRLWLSDFTYVSSWSGFVYVAFVIDAYARRIVGWSRSAISRKPKNVITPRWSNPPWRRDLMNPASGKPGAVHLRFLFRDAFGLIISEGALMNMFIRSHAGFKLAADKAKAVLRGAKVVASDETGVRIEGTNSHHWVFRCKDAVVHQPDYSRAACSRRRR